VSQGYPVNKWKTCFDMSQRRVKEERRTREEYSSTSANQTSQRDNKQQEEKKQKQRPNKRKQQTLVHIGLFGRGEVAGGFFEKRKHQGKRTEQTNKQTNEPNKPTTKNQLNKTNDRKQTKQTNQQPPNEGNKNLSRWIIILVDALYFFEKRKQEGDTTDRTTDPKQPKIQTD
jgi:hypothetical protein